MSNFIKVARLADASPWHEGKCHERYRGLNLILKVVSCDITVATHDKSFTMAEVRAGDETGIVTLRMENEQIEHCGTGSTIVVRNASALWFDKELRLEVGAFGKVTHSEDAQFEPNMSLDMSEVCA